MHYALGNSCLDEKDLGEYQECGARIATKLKRSPLLARAVGVQLYLRQNMDFWRRAESRNLLEDLMGALWWSYLHLPVPVRRCFAFCGILPRRRLIYREELIRMWIAAGFIRSTTEEDMECVANDYFDDLVSISFFQPGFLGRLQLRNCYVVHDLLHDLAVKVSGGDVFTIKYGWERKIPPTVRHLLVKNRYLDMVEMVKPLKVLRTLVLGNDNIELNDSILIALPKLRILSIPIRGLPRLPLIQSSRSTCMLSVPDSIAKLKHLRHLSFTGNFDSAEIHFPKNFAKLYHLEVLEFECRNSVIFNFGKENVYYNNLRHLISKGPLDVPYIGRARSLVTLHYFTVKTEAGFEIKQLHDLSNLRGRLRIAGLEHVRSAEEAVEAKLSCKIHLNNLVLEWKPREAVQAEIDIATEVLYSLCPPPDLERLQIIHYCGLPYPHWLVDRQTCLRGLRHLSFDNSSHPGPAPDLSSLVYLEVLILVVCKWNALPSSMCSLTKLEILEISRCPNIEELPILPNSLEYIKLWACNALFMKSCIEVGHPNWQKVDHIPCKDIGPGPSALLKKKNC